MSVTQQQVIAALKRIRGPDLESNIVDLGLVSEIAIRDGRVSFSITVPPERAAELDPLREAAQQVVSELPGVVSSLVVLTADRADGRGPSAPSAARAESPRVAAARAATGAKPTGAPPAPAHSHGHSHGPGAGAPGGPGRPAGAAGGAGKAGAVLGVKHLIAVASGKGGVGKSTVAVNVALAFKDMGLRTGIMDADIYGPSQAKLLGISGKPTLGANKKLQPLEAYGLRAMSMGLLVDEGTPLVLRGPMVTSALNQMLRDFDWPGEGGDLDVLVIDMPPGTGDIQLSLAQQTPLSGAVIVCTPQDLALIDARKGLAMFQKVDVPVLGIVENMSYFLCPKCGERSEIFGHGGAEHEAERIGVPFLGAIPLHIEIRELSDTGKPVVATQPASPNAKAFRDIAANIWAGLLAGKGAAAEPPKLEVAGDKSFLKVSFAGGASYDLSAEMLRVMSPSAEVQGHSPSQRVTVGKKRNVKIKELRPVGNYAVRIMFDDGHDTGLFSWTYLEELGREKDARWALYLSELKQKGLSRE